MRYQKPSICLVSGAVRLIQGSMNKSFPYAPDSVPPVNVATSTAYEADE